MRFVWAVVAFVLAALMIGAGIAQRTIFTASDAQTVPIESSSDAAYTVIDGSVLNLVPGSQTLTVAGTGSVFAAYGRTTDVTAWLSDATYDHVTVGADGQPQTTTVSPEAVSPSPSPTPTDSAAPDATGDTSTGADAGATVAEQAGRNPVGSDLWLDEYQQDGRLTTPLQLPETMSVLVASDGTAPAPAEVTLTWPRDVSTPWAGPLIVGGGILLLVGLVLYVLGIRNVRRSRGPRRKGLPLPVTEPIDLAVEGADKGVVSAGTPASRRALGRRSLVAVPAFALSAVLLAGCSAESWPQIVATESPSPSASVIVPEGQQSPAVTDVQAERILTRVSAAVADADAAMDPALAATRLSGAALAEREANYTLRAALPDTPALAAIPDQPLQIVLPQAFDEWPRSVLTVVEGADTTTPPTIMLMTQDDPWSDYKVSYLASLEASTLLPDLAAEYVGAVLTPPDSPFLLMQPDAVAAAYADFIDNGQNSAYWTTFGGDGDQFAAGVRSNRQQRGDEFNQTGEGTAELTFQSGVGTQVPLALTTLDGGAIVAVDLRESDTARATAEGAVIKVAEKNPTVRALTGVDQAAGFTTTYGDQLFFYIPLADSGEQIRLLGYRSNILEAKVNE